MPYDPNWPQNGQLVDADKFRAQFNSIVALINGASGITGAVVNAVNTTLPGEPATVNLSLVGTTLHFTFGLPPGANGTDGANGLNGNDGAQGPPFTNFMVDGVNTLNPGENAAVQATFDGNAVRLVFGIPRGIDGSNGQNGNDGGIGPQGPPFANAIVDAVNTLNPGEPATVSVSLRHRTSAHLLRRCGRQKFERPRVHADP